MDGSRIKGAPGNGIELNSVVQEKKDIKGVKISVQDSTQLSLLFLQLNKEFF